MPSLLALVFLAACGAPEAPPPAETPAEAPAEAPAEPAPAEPARPAEDPFAGIVTISARELPLTQELEVGFTKPGKNSCYRQSDVVTTFADGVVTHAYTTSAEGEDCVDAAVKGGFQTKVRFPSAGAWQGKIVIDGQEAALYFVDVR